MQGDGSQRPAPKAATAIQAVMLKNAFHLPGFAAVLDLMNCAMSALSLARDGAWTYIMWPAS